MKSQNQKEKVLSQKKLLWHDAENRLPHSHTVPVRVTEHTGGAACCKSSQSQ